MKNPVDKVVPCAPPLCHECAKLSSQALAETLVSGNVPFAYTETEQILGEILAVPEV